MISIAVLGHGVVGTGVCEVIEKNGAGMAKKLGDEIGIKYILVRRDYPDSPYKDKFTKNFDEILADPEVRVVAEVMGGVHPAYEYIKASLQAGKSAVTANKELVAEKGAELLAIAKENHVNFLFEASVGGGIPIVRPLHQCLAANEIHEIAGILNGTTNFILGKMIKEGMAFDTALALAQEYGYAEADPAADVEGLDACRKICILASLAFGSHVYPEGVPTEGITKLTLEDVEYAGKENCVIKLIARTHRAEDDKIFVAVGPAFVSTESPLSSVDDVYNGILVRGDATGDVVFYGKGAGKLPTASAIVGDVIDCIKAKDTIPSLSWADSDGNNLADPGRESLPRYLRCKGDVEAVKAQFSGDTHFLSRKGQPADECALIAGAMKKRTFDEKLEALQKHGVEVLSVMPLLDV